MEELFMRREEEKFMERERSVTQECHGILLQHSYQISSLGNCVMILPTKTGLTFLTPIEYEFFDNK
jgi:hypothetical protein